MSSTPNTEDQTPLMKQYWELKAQAGDALLLFRMGDFYELFGDDAVRAAQILEITLTSRDRNKANPTPMAGVPHHSVQSYIQRLLRAGHKVAIGEQMEDPSAPTAKVSGKSIVRREITRIFTPGIQFDTEGSEALYLAVLLPPQSTSAQAPREWALACLDASTGETLVGELPDFNRCLGEISRLPIRHLLHFPFLPGQESERSALSSALAASSGAGGAALQEELPPNYLSQEQAEALLKKQYAVSHLGAFLNDPQSTRALGAAVLYALRTQKQETLSHLQAPSPLRKPRTLNLGPRTAQHLDLVPEGEFRSASDPSLFSLINQTKSSLGSRQLKRWLVAPLKAPEEILLRQDGIRELSSEKRSSAERAASALSKVYDLERICGRVNTKLANPRDTLALGKSLDGLHEISALLDGVQSEHGRVRSMMLRDLGARLNEARERLEPLRSRILKTQLEEAPLVAREGGIFAKGTSEELDRLLDLTENGQRWLVDLEAREREATGIPSLKVRYNRVFGYYLEVTQAHLKSVPSHYQRKQTTVGAERFFTEELKKFEDEIVNASSKQKALEIALFEDLLAAVLERTSDIMEAARALGELDSLIALSKLAREPGWCFPKIDDSLDLEIRGGRHPLVDATSRGTFVPNDLHLSPSTRQVLMITGPNMGGKSTVMRQTALIVILGQMGAPVPATEARWGAVSSVFTRIGAHDAIARGQSTFMVEMSELAHILHHADERSLVILDEIGRGTSTYDGMSVAWSTLEWICDRIRARTLFATHYHELTRLAERIPLLDNAHMAVAQDTDQESLRFLYLLREGPANESFGVHVARIAGVPKPVIERAWEVLEELEKGSMPSDRKPSPPREPRERRSKPSVAQAVHSAQLALF